MVCIIMYSIIYSYPGGLEVEKSSSILFTTLPLVFYTLPGGGFLSFVFYLLVAFGALTSTISLMEVVSSWAIDELKWKRKQATITLGAAIWVFGVLAALSVGGHEHGANGFLSGINLIGRESTEGFFGTLDYLASNWFLPVGGFLIALFVGWWVSGAMAKEELEAGHGTMKSYAVWRFFIRFAAPLAVGAIIISVILGAEYQ
jgi:NSS family neurotransmitter:Na+ symporter